MALVASGAHRRVGRPSRQERASTSWTRTVTASATTALNGGVPVLDGTGSQVRQGRNR
ncbi:MAG: hypothetical protein R2856_10490 [Caldilineaceae bacterium]